MAQGYPVDTAVDSAAVVEGWGVVKSFYSVALGESVPAGPIGLDQQSPLSRPAASRARVAVYDAPAAAPRVVDVEPRPVAEYIESLAATVYHLAKEQGGDIPYSVVREVSENFIHADFSEPVISILDDGQTIRFADRGPGIPDKDRAVLPGFTTATGEMKQYIRGVGSGLPLVRDFLCHCGGALVVEDNLGHGAVVTVSSGKRGPASGPHRSAETVTGQPAASTVEQAALPTVEAVEDTLPASSRFLTTRQKQVLALVMESGSAGPSIVSRELGVGLSTAYRDLASLEEIGLISSDGGKRTLTSAGLSYLDTLTSGA